MALTLDEANRIVEGAIAAANEMGIKINVAVVDAGGRLMAFNRMDGAIWAGAYGSQGKAVASAAFGRTSGELQERSESPIIRGILAAEGGHGIPQPGRRPHHPRRRRGRRRRRRRRNQPRGRRLRQGGDCEVVGVVFRGAPTRDAPTRLPWRAKRTGRAWNPAPFCRVARVGAAKLFSCASNRRRTGNANPSAMYRCYGRVLRADLSGAPLMMSLTRANRWDIRDYRARGISLAWEDLCKGMMLSEDSIQGNEIPDSLIPVATIRPCRQASGPSPLALPAWRGRQLRSHSARTGCHAQRSVMNLTVPQPRPVFIVSTTIAVWA